MCHFNKKELLLSLLVSLFCKLIIFSHLLIYIYIYVERLFFLNTQLQWEKYNNILWDHKGITFRKDHVKNYKIFEQLVENLCHCGFGESEVVLLRFDSHVTYEII